MATEFLDNFDVAVIGAGHAGIEAALSAARLGMRTVIFSISLDEKDFFVYNYKKDYRKRTQNYESGN